ncbi:hypothetical protein ACFE04_027027 [Oxalis oulophora]
MKVSLITLLILILTTAASASYSSSSSNSIIIVGAGMSGITAAKTLSENGIKDFLMLEATDRIGGRMKKASFANHTVELGANWLFRGGPKINIISEIANKIKLKTFFSDYDHLSTHTYKQNGGLYSKKVMEVEIKTADERFDFNNNLSKALSAQGKKDNDISVLAEAEPPRITSLKNTFPREEFEDFGENEYFVADPRGYEAVVHYIAKQFLVYKNGLLADPRVKLNKVVREISYTKSGVMVKTKNGEVYKAKYAIVSVSLGVLQSNLIQFKPILPQWKTLAIDDFDMSVYTKIFMKFPRTFWPTGPGTEFFLYAHERRGYYPIWQHLENEMPGSNILFVTVTDTEAIRIEQQSDKETDSCRDNGSVEEIIWFYKGTYANWPAGYTQLRYQELKAPIGRVYFTGEHTNSTYIGYVNGAYYSGINTANDLIKCFKYQSCSIHQG